MHTRYFKVAIPEITKDKVIIAVQLETESSSVEELKEALKLKLNETILKEQKLTDCEPIVFLDNLSHLAADYQITNESGKHEVLPIEAIILNNTLEKKHTIDVSHYYRIWFSNDPDIFLPTFEKLTIEESIKANPEIQTSLIVNKAALNTQALEALKAWSKLNNCQIIDINNIQPETYVDKTILAIVINELAAWKDNAAGNPAIASDFIRLLFLDKGIYLDCDVILGNNMPTIVKSAQGAFVNLAYINPYLLNTDVMTFSSDEGKAILEELKAHIIANYFNSHIPQPKELDNAITNEIASRKKTLDAQTDKSKRKEVLGKIVTHLAGPYALQAYLKESNHVFKNNDTGILNYLKRLKVDACTSFVYTTKNQISTRCSWLDANYAKKNTEINYYAGQYREYLQDLRTNLDDEKTARKAIKPNSN